MGRGSYAYLLYQCFSLDSWGIFVYTWFIMQFIRSIYRLLVIGVIFAIPFWFGASAYGADFSCNLSKISSHDYSYTPCTGQSTGGDGCPNLYNCCVQAFSGETSSGVGLCVKDGYDANLLAARGVVGLTSSIASESNSVPLTFADFDSFNNHYTAPNSWTLNLNGNSQNIVTSPCSGTPLSGVPREPNYTKCSAGESYWGFELKQPLIGGTEGYYNFYCAINPQCCGSGSGTGVACNINRPCCEKLINSVSTIKCQIFNAADPLLSGACLDCPTQADIGTACSTTKPCCGANASSFICAPNVARLAVTSLPTDYFSACIPSSANPAIPFCGTKRGNGDYCSLNNQCASSNCGFSGTDLVKKCIAVAADGACSGVDSACECVSGKVCRSSGTSGFKCLDPIQCKNPGEIGCTIGDATTCCASTDHLYKCENAPLISNPTIKLPTCVQDTACIPNNDSCTVGGTGCCPKVDGTTHSEKPYVCQITPLPNIPSAVWVAKCTPAAACTLLTTGCTQDSQCCPSTHPGFACVNGACAQSTTGTDCTGNTCVGCPLGFTCNGNGKCDFDASKCGPALPTYTGPRIQKIDDLIATIYRILYPLAILFGLYSIIKAGYKIMVSEGNPQSVKEGQEEITSAVLGILFIMLSLVLIRVIIKAILNVDSI